MIAKRVLFEGRVQGVGFRYEVKQLTTGYDVVGSVKNLPDGTVELRIMGAEDEVEEFLKEIIGESTMSYYIRDMRSHEIPLMENVRGFTISG